MADPSQLPALSKGLTVKYIKERLSILDVQDRDALYQEFKEWVDMDKEGQDLIWSIPDLTNKALCSFFIRAISTTLTRYTFGLQ